MLTLFHTESGAIVVLALSVDCFPQPGANHLKATKCPTRDTNSLVRHLYISVSKHTHLYLRHVMQIFLLTGKKLTRKTHLQNQSSLSNQGGKLQTVSLTRVSLQKLPGSFFYFILFYFTVICVESECSPLSTHVKSDFAFCKIPISSN